jgi:hypothetical protein
VQAVRHRGRDASTEEDKRKRIIFAAASVLALGLAGCNQNQSAQPAAATDTGSMRPNVPAANSGVNAVPQATTDTGSMQYQQRGALPGIQRSATPGAADTGSMQLPPPSSTGSFTRSPNGPTQLQQ